VNQAELLLHLSGRFSAAAWSQALPAWRQDGRVWARLIGGGLAARLVSVFPPEAEAWSPAGMALFDLDPSLSLATLSQAPLAPLPKTLHSQAARAFEDWQSRPSDGPATLAQAALWALWLRERLRVTGSWDGLKAEVGGRLGELHTTCAILYGLLSDPFPFLSALVEIEGGLAAALHSLLSNPLTEESQGEIIFALLGRMRPTASLTTMRALSEQRPALAQRLAVRWLRLPADDLVQRERRTRLPQLDSLDHLLQVAEGQRLARMADAAQQTLAQAQTAVRRVEAYLALRAAQACEASGEYEAALPFWQAAQQAAPESESATSGWLTALARAGRLREGEALAASGARAAFATGARWQTALAYLALACGARPAGRAALAGALAAWQQVGAAAALYEFFPGGAPEADLELLLTLGDLALRLDAPGLAEAAAQAGAAHAPNHPEMLELAARANLAQDRPAEALATALAAAALQPEITRPQQLVIEALEGMDEWKRALAVRLSLMSHPDQLGGATPAGALAEALRALAACAAQAGDWEAARRACQEGLQLLPADSDLQACLAEADFWLDTPERDPLADLQALVGRVPQATAGWLTLTRLQQEAARRGRPLGKPSRMEMLRAAVLAVPEAAEIQLALGEALVAAGAPTQALTALRAASALTGRERGATVAQRRAQRRLREQVAALLGGTLADLGFLDEAEEVLAAAFAARQADASNLALARRLAQVRLGRDDLAGAVAPLEEVVRCQPEDGEATLALARALLAQERRDSALGLRCVALLQPLTETEAAPAEAQALLPEAQALLPEAQALLAEAQALLAEALALAGEAGRAVAAYRLALETPLGQSAAWRGRLAQGLGGAALALGQIETAVAALQEAVQAQPGEPSSYRLLAEACLAAGLGADALAAGQAALQLAPANVVLLSWFATLAAKLQALPLGERLGAGREGMLALARAVKLAPDRLDLLLRLGQAQYAAGERGAAGETFARLAAADLDGADAPSVAELYAAAVALRDLGATEAAVILLGRLVHRSGPAADASFSPTTLLVELAAAQRQAGDLTAALTSLERALEIDAANVTLLARKADLLLELARQPEALMSLEAALALAPQALELRLRAARLRRAQGDLLGARQHAEAALAAGRERSMSPLGRAVQTLAAELAQATLQFSEADAALGGDLTEEPGEAPLAFCERLLLRAELDLDASAAARRAERALMWEAEVATGRGETLPVAPPWEAPENRAAQAIMRAAEVMPAQGPQARLLAAQARLAGRRMSSGAAAQALLAQAVAALPGGEPRLHWEGREQRTLRLTLGTAALELGAFELSLPLLTAQAEETPHEALAQFRLAQGLIRQAEVQRTLAALGMRRRLPGAMAVGSAARQAAGLALEAAAAILGWRLDQPPQTQGTQLLARWAARRTAVFGGGGDGVPAWQALAARQADGGRAFTADDAAALTASLAGGGQLTAAVRVAQAWPHDPETLFQLALSLAEENGRQAVGVLHTLRAQFRGLAGGGEAALWQLPRLAAALLARIYVRSSGRSLERGRALEAIEAALAAWPDEPAFHLLAAEIHLVGPEADAALSAAGFHLQETVRLDPTQADAWRRLAQVLGQRGEGERARAVLRAACEQHPQSEALRLDLAQVLRTAGLFSEALAAAEAAERVGREAGREPQAARLLQGQIALAAGQPRRAQTLAQAVLDVETEQAEAWMLLTAALTALERPVEALHALGRALPLVDEPLGLLLRRAALLRLTEGPGAQLAALEDLAGLYGELPVVQGALALALAEVGEDERALMAAQLALQGVGALQLGAAAEMEPIDPVPAPADEGADDETLTPGQIARLHALIGAALRAQGQLDGALFQLEAALAADSSLAAVYLMLGEVWQSRRQPEAALAVYQRGAAACPQDYRLPLEAGVLLNEAHDFEQAETYLLRAKDLRPAGAAEPVDVRIRRLLGAVVAQTTIATRRA
jgi:Tfp pilus assembly protein PilF